MIKYNELFVLYGHLLNLKFIFTALLRGGLFEVWVNIIFYL